MYEEKITDDLDYKGMYEGLANCTKLDEQRMAVLNSAIILEVSVNMLVDLVIKKIESPSLRKWSENAYVTINSKLLALRFANIINEELFSKLKVIFKIRNEFAHKLLLSGKECAPLFSPLKDVKIGKIFFNKLPNDSRKYQLLTSHCAVRIMKIMECIDPNSVQQLVGNRRYGF